jgi:hypothetical protein
LPPSSPNCFASCGRARSPRTGVDLQDHLAAALNNLRFSESVWESHLFSSSGFYTNRIRYSEMIQSFKDAGFESETVQLDRWDELPTPRRRMDTAFRDMPDDELLVRGFDVVLRKPAAGRTMPR